MSDAPKVELHFGPQSKDNRMTIDGVDVTRSVGVPLRVDVDGYGDATVTVSIPRPIVSAHMSGDSIRFDDETVAILKAAGWTAPGEALSAERIKDAVVSGLNGWTPVVRIEGRDFYGSIKKAVETHRSR